MKKNSKCVLIKNYGLAIIWVDGFVFNNNKLYHVSEYGSVFDSLEICILC